MKYNEFKLKKVKSTHRVGRGISAGRGKTAGRGTKGQGSRKSGGVRPGFEGGQTPLYMQLPKLRGFTSKRAVVENIYTGQLDQIKKATVDSSTLAEAGLISSPHVRVKLISRGELKAKKLIKVQAASAQAIKEVEKAGGQVDITAQLARSPKMKTS